MFGSGVEREQREAKCLMFCKSFQNPLVLKYICSRSEWHKRELPSPRVSVVYERVKCVTDNTCLPCPVGFPIFDLLFQGRYTYRYTSYLQLPQCRPRKYTRRKKASTVCSQDFAAVSLSKEWIVSIENLQMFLLVTFYPISNHELFFENIEEECNECTPIALVRRLPQSVCV